MWSLILGHPDSHPLDVSATVRTLVRLWPRCIAAYTLLTLLVYITWPQISMALGYCAQSLVLVANPIPYLAETSSTTAGLVISDRMLGITVLLPREPLLFVLFFPLGFALALPGLRTHQYWLRVTQTFAVSAIACILLLAIHADLQMAKALWKFKIEIHPAWYDVLLGSTSLWDFMIVLFPFLSLLVLARPFVAVEESAFGFFRPRSRPSRQGYVGRASVLWLLVLLLIAGVEIRGNQLRAYTRDTLMDELAARNPLLGDSLALYADSLMERGKVSASRRWYVIASKYRNADASAHPQVIRERVGKPQPNDTQLEP